MNDQEIMRLMRRLRPMVKFQYPLLIIGYFRSKIETGAHLLVNNFFYSIQLI
jgi:hypothetical protein